MLQKNDVAPDFTLLADFEAKGETAKKYGVMTIKKENANGRYS